ncbi:NADH-quinone oxidoreductase subunit N [Thermopirellula anaerolimosa]
MNLPYLLEQLEGDAYFSLRLFAPEGLVCVTILLLLLSRMLLPSRRRLPYSLAFLGVVAALAAAVMQWPMMALLPHLPQTAVSGFTGLLRFDLLGLFFRILFLGFSAVFVIFLAMTRLPEDEDVGEFLVLYLASILGLCVMASADHLLMVLLGMEMAGVPGYMLAGFIKSRRASGEAAVKFALFGAASAGTMLYGMTLVAGSLGSFHLPTIGLRLAALTEASDFASHAPVLVLGLLMLLVGLAFKLSAVPFHFWVPDVFEGAAAEVGAYLSTVSKAGALILLIRLTAGFLGADPTVTRLPDPAQFAATDRAIPADSVLPHAGAVRLAAIPGTSPDGRDAPVARPVAASSLAAASNPRSPADVVGRFLAAVIAFLAAVSCTFGNLAAYGQRNFKRLLAYSTIAHAGYMLMPVAAAAMLWRSQPELARWAVAATALYVVVYLIMNLGAFAATAFLRDAFRSETIDDFAGWVRFSPGLTVAVTVIMFSLIGLPPLAGFAAKFAAFASLTYAGLWTLLVVGAANTAISLFYYLRVVKVMVLESPSEAVIAARPTVGVSGVTFVSALALSLIVLGVLWQPLFSWAKAAAGVP